MAVMMPVIGGNCLAYVISKQSGNAIRYTSNPLVRSAFQLFPNVGADG